jgi:hypothetical protein
MDQLTRRPRFSVLKKDPGERTNSNEQTNQEHLKRDGLPDRKRSSQKEKWGQGGDKMRIKRTRG